MITLAQFFMGRDVKYKSELTQEIKNNASVTVLKVNKLLEKFIDATGINEARGVNSGWRPPSINAKIPNAAPRSNHMLGLACDVSDDEGSLDAWLMTQDGQKAMEEIGLWHEHPSATPRWCHVQTVPNRSWVLGKTRTFKP